MDLSLREPFGHSSLAALSLGSGRLPALWTEEAKTYLPMAGAEAHSRFPLCLCVCACRDGRGGVGVTVKGVVCAFDPLCFPLAH